MNQLKTVGMNQLKYIGMNQFNIYGNESYTENIETNQLKKYRKMDKLRNIKMNEDQNIRIPISTVNIKKRIK